MITNALLNLQIGLDFALKFISWDTNTIIRLQLWDIAGQERFGSMTRIYYKDAVGALICFDISKMETFDAIKKWKDDLDQKLIFADGSSIPCVLVANKVSKTKPKQTSDGNFGNECHLINYHIKC